jgi:hypothetical protein
MHRTYLTLGLAGQARPPGSIYPNEHPLVTEKAPGLTRMAGPGAFLFLSYQERSRYFC